MKSKKILSTIILIITILGFSTISNAALESKAGQNSWKASTANDHFSNIRAMEKSGGTLGMNANIDKTTYLDSSGNGIDVHMALATEWGTAALLAISDYGAYNSKGIVSDAGTKVAATTGNITGVFQMGDGYAEYVAGILENRSNASNSKLYLSDNRYYNLYEENKIEKYHKGDGIYQTQGWYNSASALYLDSENPEFYRGKGLFGFGSYTGYIWKNNKDYSGWIYARACIVCGEGL